MTYAVAGNAIGLSIFTMLAAGLPLWLNFFL
jgi:hypothetical protein